MPESKPSKMKRRRFLTGVLTAAPALGLAGALAPAESAAAQAPAGAGQKSEAPQKNSIPDRSLEAVETTTPDVPRLTVSNPGSDFMVDVIKSLNFEYVAAVPGSSFRGFQESWVNYGGNKPEWITCLHEDSSVGIAGRLREDVGQAAAGDDPRGRRAAARADGDLQRVLRPRAHRDDCR